MPDPNERLTPGVSDFELERRWALAREVMKIEKVDHLLAREDEQFLGGQSTLAHRLDRTALVPHIGGVSL